ncbi:efflux transporter outer membrane subunit [Sphingobium phenoxybenzoativorans]|uniref:Efflux transporter outer membrane subunit n=2 Tax=Sphingobium phenoxybenzoativorans TaxID=1592790 RepID=A0A975K8P9_9SPHN|nr:efflux transporter outer membrane subunit [Sphingobium phenoxybenzoativorans]QUT06424.1 efflux transporter outer membrane subunit [Sphingobium phenoxybenzoativorans]
MRRLLLSASAVLALSACAVGPDYHAPKPLAPAQTDLKEATAGATLSVDPLPEKWWRLFDDPTLDGLVEKALAHNTDLRVAAANLKRARAVLGEARAARLPTTNVSAQGTYQQIGIGNPQMQGLSGPIRTDFYTAGFDASYELDLFGGVSRSIEAARGDYGAAQAALDAARVSIAAETARTYASACGFGAQAATARETVELQAKTLDLTQRLLSGGRGTQRDVDQSTILVEQARAQAATFEAEHRAALYALAVLTGEPPASAEAAIAACTVLPTVKQPIPVGDGKAMLARRPDVREAERTLAADTARVGVATAALYPSITLLGSISVGGTQVSDLTKSDSISYSVGPLLSWNFPFSGAARARVRQNKAIAEGSLASFDKAVLTALQETEQALARLKGAVDREASLSRAMAAANSASFIAEKRFDAGSDSFLQLLVAQNDRANARAALAQAQSDRAEAQVALFKALGGGWEGAPVPTAISAAGEE